MITTNQQKTGEVGTFMVDVSIWIAFGAGILSFLSPCTLPLIPSYLSFITGLSYDQLVDKSGGSVYRRRVIIHSLLFIAGFSIAFISLGFSFSLIGGMFAENQNLIRKIGGVLIIFFGLFIAFSMKIPFLMQDHIVNIRNKPAGYLGTLLVGLVFAVGWTPCVGPILGSILLIAGTEQEIQRGLVLLISFSLGLALPFFLSSLAISHFFNVFSRFKNFMPVCDNWIGHSFDNHRRTSVHRQTPGNKLLSHAVVSRLDSRQVIEQPYNDFSNVRRAFRVSSRLRCPLFRFQAVGSVLPRDLPERYQHLRLRMPSSSQYGQTANG